MPLLISHHYFNSQFLQERQDVVLSPCQTLWERSNIIWRFRGRGFAQTVRVSSYGRRGWPNRYI